MNQPAHSAATATGRWRACVSRRAVVRLASLLVASLALAHCSSVASYKTHDPWVKVRYSTGGAAPVVTELAIADPGLLDLVTTDWQTLSRPVAGKQLVRLRRILKSKEMSATLRAAQPANSLHSADEESILLSVGKRQYFFPTAVLPPVVRTFLEAIDDLFSRIYGQRYSLRIPY